MRCFKFFWLKYLESIVKQQTEARDWIEQAEDTEGHGATIPTQP